MPASCEASRVQYNYFIELIKSYMRKILWPIIALISLVLSTYSFILGSKVIEKTQSPPPIYITYPEGYLDLPKDSVKVKTSKNKKIKLEKP